MLGISISSHSLTIKWIILKSGVVWYVYVNILLISNLTICLSVFLDFDIKFIVSKLLITSNIRIQNTINQSGNYSFGNVGIFW